MGLFDSGVRPLVDEYLAKKQAEVRDYGDYWSASSAGYCMRLNILKRLGTPEVPEIQEDKARTTRVFESGHIFHEWLQRITKDAGISVASEVELQDEELMIRGHFDDLVLIKGKDDFDDVYGGLGEKGFHHAPDIEPDHLILYDYKTAHSGSFKWKKQQTEIGHYHKMQLGTYLYMLKKNGLDIEGVDAKSVTEARILSISKDDLRMDEKQLMWTPQLKREVEAYWTELNRWWNDKKLPPCTCVEHDGGFMSRRSSKGKIYNSYFYNDAPCSLEWYALCKEQGRIPK